MFGKVVEGGDVNMFGKEVKGGGSTNVFGKGGAGGAVFDKDATIPGVGRLSL